MFACLEFLQHREPTCYYQVPDLALYLLGDCSLENKNSLVRVVIRIRWRHCIWIKRDVFLCLFLRNKKHENLWGTKFVSSQYWAEICSVSVLCCNQICVIIPEQWWCRRYYTFTNTLTCRSLGHSDLQSHSRYTIDHKSKVVILSDTRM